MYGLAHETDTKQKRKFLRRITRKNSLNVAFALILYFHILWFLIRSQVMNKPLRLITAIAIGICVNRILHRRMIRRAAAGNSTAEEFAVANADLLPESPLLQEILAKKERNSHRAQLLRPSEKTDNDTLLRAATHTDATPQEQLLRPADNTDGV